MNQKKTVVVAVKASKDIPKTAMEWALTHVVQPGNCIKLLVVISPGKKHWGFQRFTTDCTTGNWRSQMGTLSDQKDYVTDSCSQLMHQLCQDYNSCKIHVKMKVVSGLTTGVVAAEAEKTQASWVILDKMLKAEAKYCMEQLQCNIVIMKGLEPKVLRLNLAQPGEAESDEIYPLLSKEEALLQNLEDTYDSLDSIQVPNVTPTSSPEHETQFSSTDIGTSSVSSSEAGPTTNLYSESTGVRKLSFPSAKDSEKEKFDGTNSDTGSDSMSSASFDQPWMLETSSLVTNRLLHMAESSQRVTDEILASASLTLQKRFSSTFHEKPTSKLLNHRLNMNSAWSLRETISLSKNSPAEPPPLCSICQNKTPIFGKPPRSFTYAELALATNGFSESNFLSEGGFGSVHRGMLPDGQVVAVKQHKAASSQGDLEFRSEVEVLSCAQHRNVVMLIGFCIEGGRRLLVYEYVCNGSLDSHIYSKSRTPLKWSARQKVAVGAARGLRYLHEECRVGCIVHRDMRPNNILITHDFEPLVGDFGLARCQPDGGLGEETRVIGTFGYLAPEYAQTGQITEKADVYSFGIVLLELVTGRKAVDLNRPKGEQCLTEWARPLLKKQAVKEMIDPRLRDEYSDREVYAMLHCASFCIRRDPDLRPRMSQVLRMLEGDVMGSIS